MEQQPPQRLELDISDLYALIGQLTVENRVLRGRLAVLSAAAPAATPNGAGPGIATWRDLEPAEAT